MLKGVGKPIVRGTDGEVAHTVAIDVTEPRERATDRVERVVVERGRRSIDSVCGPLSVLPGSCPADIDHNGETDFDDLLEVLSTYGPCP